jgi:VanZ like family.
MKNNIFNIIKYSYFLLIIILIIIYLYPGSLIGYFLYGNLETQPNIISNPIGTSINHMIYFSLITILAYLIKSKSKNLLINLKFIFFLSIFLELLHLIIPNRAFEYFDLIANIIGVLLAIFLLKLLRWQNT